MSVKDDDQNSDIELPEEQSISPYRPRTISMHRNINRRMSRGASTDTQDWMQTASNMSRVPVEDHVNHIVDKIEEEEQCLLTVSERQDPEFRRDALRNMPQSLAMKKMVKEKLNMRLTKGKQISMWKQMKFSFSMSMKKCTSNMQDCLYSFELWYSTMKKVESEFGSATAIYFRFFRFLFILNLVSFAIAFCFVILPQGLDFIYYGNKLQTSSFQLKDFFTGQGYFTNTLLYYGTYTNETIHIADNFSYSLPRGYFYTMIVVYVSLLLIFAISMARSYRINFIETKGGLKNVYAHKVFCNWDFGIATENAAKLKSSAIYHEFKELLDEEMKPLQIFSWKERFRTFMLRFSANLLILAGVAAIGYGIWKLLENNLHQHSNELVVVVTALVINAVIYIVPKLLSLVSHYEDYKNPRTAFNVTLRRTFILQIVVIFVFGFFWFSRSEPIECWENALGQEIYRLMIYDFIFTIVFFLFEKVIYLFVGRLKHAKMERPEFEIAGHALQLIYNQALFWFGLVFAPLISALVVIKYFILWYFVSSIVIKFCKPSTKFWRATQTQTWFLVMVFLTLILVLSLLGVLIATVEMGKCGPFTGDSKKYMWDFLVSEILQLEEGTIVWKVLLYIVKPGVVALIIISLLGMIYYLRAKAISQKKMVDLLRKMLLTEAVDKEYLLKRINALVKEWKFTSVDPIKTPNEKYFMLEETQTEFQRNESTVVPQRSDRSTWTHSSNEHIPTPTSSKKSKIH